MSGQRMQSLSQTKLQSPAPPGLPARRVMVHYRSSESGRAALAYAMSLAQETSATLTVLSVATRVPVNGCASCRHSAVIWNREMHEIAREELAEAATLVARCADVRYIVGVGDPLKAVSEAADRSGADTVVVPHESGGRLRRLLAAPVEESLRKLGRWEVVTAPPPTGLVDGR